MPINLINHRTASKLGRNRTHADTQTISLIGATHLELPLFTTPSNCLFSKFFFLKILFDSRRHIRACLVKPKDGITETVETVTAKQYRRIEAITAQIAKESDLKGYELQAIVWVSIKESWGAIVWKPLKKLNFMA